jgi:hypothetical protein
MRETTRYSKTLNVITASCGELWIATPSPEVPEYKGHYITQKFLDNEDGEMMIGEFCKDDVVGGGVGDHVWTFGGEWTTDDIYLIEVTQEELDEIDTKIRRVDNFVERCVGIPVPTLLATLSFDTVDGDDDVTDDGALTLLHGAAGAGNAAAAVAVAGAGAPPFLSIFEYEA